MTPETVTGTFTTDTGQQITGTFTTTAGLAHMLGISRRAVTYHIQAGHIPAYRVGQPHLVPLATAKRIARQRAGQRHKTWPKEQQR